MRPFLLVIAMASLAGPAGAQLRLADALARADAAAIVNRAAGAQRDVARAQTIAPLRGILPSVRVEAGYVRTTDPIGAFGTALRQRHVTAADFAPDRLNHPDIASNYTGALVLDVPLVNADAWLGHAAARRAAESATASGEWTRESTRADVVRAYFGAVLATARVRALEAASQSASAHVRQARTALTAGLVTPSDAMLASVKAGELDADLASARGDATTARRALAVLLGYTDGRSIEPMDALPSTATLRDFAAADTTTAAERRADVEAANAGAAAARADADRARSTYLPRLNAFARSDWNDGARLYANERNWTVGVMASWSPFTGAAEIADTRATAARAQAARAMADGALAAAGLDAARTATELHVALERLDIAERAVTQVTDAHRIVSRRYDGGMATVVELLDASATETRTIVALDKARHDVIIALAARRLAIGLDPGSVAALATPASSPQFRGIAPMKARISLLVALFAAACGSGGDQRPAAKASAGPAGTLVSVRDTTIDAMLDADGVAAPIEQAIVSTKLMGTVTEVLVHEGDHVSRGQVLARIDARDVDAKHAQAAAAVSAADASQGLALAQARRMRALHADSAAPKAALDAAETGLQQAEAALRAARAMTTEVDAVRDYAVVRAPFDGIVTKRFADAGAFAAPGMPLVQVQDASRLRVTVTTTPAAARSLRRGSVIDATIDGGAVRGIVEGVVPSGAGGVYTVNAIVANATGTLPSGTSATAHIPDGTRRALFVPAAAVVRDGDLTAVRVSRDGVAALRWVKTGAVHGADVEILSGVRAGEQVLVPNAKGA